MSKMEVLISTSDEVQLGIIMSILKEHKIPFIKQDTSLGGYMRIYSGSSVYGTQILVNEADIQKASGLIDNLLPKLDEFQEEQEGD
jgi:hypothetical protein